MRIRYAYLSLKSVNDRQKLNDSILLCSFRIGNELSELYSYYQSFTIINYHSNSYYYLSLFCFQL